MTIARGLALALWGLAGCAPTPAVAPTSTPPSAGAPAGETASDPDPTVPELEAVTIPPRPAWTDRYAIAGSDTRHFNISTLMQQYGLDRAQAVELQNHYRDLVLADPGGEPALHFEAARTRAQRGEFEDRRDLARLKAAPFIIVFDLDETLYSQYYDPVVAATCHDLEVSGENGGSRYVKLNPGWKTAIERVVGLGGAVVMFTANTDANGYQNAAVWMMDDHPILESDKISGFLTNAHLVQQEKSEGAGAADPRRGQPVQEPSKDLRIIDPSLRRVVLVDDNPARVFQHRNLRLFKKFDAHAYCTATDDALKAAYAVSLDRVVDEIEDSARYMKAEGGDFVGAYLPFTMLGQVAVMFVQDTMGKSRKAAIAYVREHPDLVDETF